MCDTCGCKGAETFDAEREIHQLIIFDGSRADTLVFENPDDIKDYLYEGLYGSENLSDEKWYIDDDGAEELNKQNFDKKTKNMSINEVIEFLYLDDLAEASPKIIQLMKKIFNIKAQSLFQKKQLF